MSYTMNNIVFEDHGFDLAMEQREGFRIHVCYYNNDCYARDLAGELSMNLTDEMLEWYLVNRAKDSDEDHSIKFTEVWYDPIDGERVEIKRRETTYSNELMRRFMRL